MNISPVDNLYDKPDNLDPQPEFPLRTELTFYKEESWESQKLEMLEGDVLGEDGSAVQNSRQITEEPSAFPSVMLLFVLWMIGLCFWCFFFLRSTASPGLRRKKAPRKKNSNVKTVKDV